MKGLMYIAGSFHTVQRNACGGGKGWIDNDPHFWTQPPTWGICRNDLRHRADEGDYIFFVLPRNAQHLQCLFAYMRVAKKITHDEAYRNRYLISKRMGNKNPNGNIIVNEYGRYNRFDGGAHRHMFENIKREYVVSDPINSRLLTSQEIGHLAPSFNPMLQDVFGSWGTMPIRIISRYGRTLNPEQVNEIIRWSKA